MQKREITLIENMARAVLAFLSGGNAIDFDQAKSEGGNVGNTLMQTIPKLALYKLIGNGSN